MSANRYDPYSVWNDVLGDDRDPLQARVAPGKVTLTSRLPAPGRGPVQRKPTTPAAGRVSSPEHVHTAAEVGTRGTGSDLPHRDAIQTSFGRYDISGVQAYVGGPAADANAAIGARAFATGDRVAFREQPDLHTAAHEAAHVVQQQSGVTLKGGIGESGDVYEQHADAVADRVVSGESAESLLDGYADGGRGRDSQAQLQKSDEEASTPATGEDGGPALTYGNTTEISATARIPTPIAGLTVNITFTGKYSTLHENGQDAVEMEGIAQISLNYSLLFLNLSLFVRGGVKSKVRGTTSGDEALSRSIEDISHWIAARELADLPAKRLDVAREYMNFETALTGIYIDLINSSSSDRHDELDEASWGWFDDNALANIIDARNNLVEDVREIFSDMDGTIRGNEIYPGTHWIRQQIQPFLDHDRVIGSELSTFYGALNDEGRRRREQVVAQLEQIPAIQNDPDVEFEANVQLGASVGISLTEDNSASVEIGRGLRIGDAMGDTSFDTSTRSVVFGSIEVSGKVGELDVQGALSYEGIGLHLTDPDEFKVGGSVFVGMSAEAEDPEAYASTLEGVKNRVFTADLNARVDGVSRLRTLGNVLKREIGAAQRPSWRVGGSSMAGFDVEFKFKKPPRGNQFEGNGGHVKFVITNTGSFSLGAFEGSVQNGSFVGITW